MDKKTNPFVVGGYMSPEYFCDREEETSMMLRRFENNISTTIMAIRRIGKTGLIKHVLGQLGEKRLGIYTDILPSENLNHFNEYLLTAIAGAVKETDSVGKKVWGFIRSLRPVISFDSYTGQPQVSVNAEESQLLTDLGSAFNLLESLKIPVVIAIDEFQQILNYPEKNFDAHLRTMIQPLKNITFIFSGSQQHLLNDVFADPSKPFYRATQVLKLDKIPKEKYSQFILSKFTAGKKSLSEQTVDEILKWAECHTYYVQVLCNRLFGAGYKSITHEIWREEAWKILTEQEILFYRYRDLLSTQQWQLLKAVAAYDKVYSPTSQEFMKKHNLNSSAGVVKGLETLKSKEIVYEDFDEKGSKYYSVYDLFFKRWVQERYS